MALRRKTRRRVRFDDDEPKTEGCTLRGLVPSFLDYLRHERRYSDHTIAAYDADLRGMIDHLEAMAFTGGPDELDANRIRIWLSTIHERTQARTRARKLSALRSFFRFLVKNGLATRNVGDEVLSPKLPRPVPRAISADEVFSMLEADMADTPLNRRDLAMIELLYGAGLRAAELVALDIDRVNLTTRSARVVGKGNKERIVPFGRKAEASIRRWLERRPELVDARRAETEALFLNAKGCLLYTSPSPRDLSTSRMPSSA